MKTTIAAIILAALSANAFASATDELDMRPPMLTAKTGGIAAATCAISILAADGQTYEIDPIQVGDKLVKAGEYHSNPFARFAGKGTLWTGIHSSQCIAAAGRIAAAYGIQRAYIDFGDGLMAVGSPTGDVLKVGDAAGAYTTSFINFAGPVGAQVADGEVRSVLKFQNVRRGAL